LNIADSCGNAISYNFLSHNNRNGVLIQTHSDNNTLWNNTFYHNSGGSESYSINHIQAADGGANNRWNSSDGYGNWWSDWQGRDFDSDGIQDAPYNISAGYPDVKDYFPLSNVPAAPMIPEFSDIMVPVIGLALIMLVFRSARARKE
jgi:nitrous oxidase accessory protein NosD